MDTSKTYQRMCDCPEIQEQQPYAKDAVNSFFHRKEMRYIESETIWLPRQDQIQEMTWGKFDNPVMKMREFVDFMEYWLWLDLDTVEQQLLAFYMHEKFKKIWNDVRGKWVKK